jgi:hypothetical protein
MLGGGGILRGLQLELNGWLENPQVGEKGVAEAFKRFQRASDHHF